MKYFDNAATTPLADEVKKAMMPFFEDNFGNAGSLHTLGSNASHALIQARQQVAEFLNCDLKEIYFTSGATESNNMFLKGILQTGDHVIVSAIEHPCISETVKYLETQGVLVSYVLVNSDGLVEIEKVRAAVQEKTKVVSIMMVNNEIGTIQPIKEIGEMISEINKNREQKIYFHTDAVQAAPYIALDVEELKVDALSLSGHKIYGPKGVGVLYLKQGIEIVPLIHGGGQELGRRSGTENIAGIIGMAAATQYIRASYDQLDAVRGFRDDLLQKLQGKFPQMNVHGDMNQRIPGNLNISFPGIEGEQLIYLLDLAGFAVSSVSACSSKGLEPSRVLLAMGASQEEARGTMRITIGLQHKQEDIDALYVAICDVVEKLQ